MADSPFIHQTTLKFDDRTQQRIVRLKTHLAASKSDVVRRAIALLDAVTTESIVNQKSVAVLDSDGKVDQKITVY